MKSFFFITLIFFMVSCSTKPTQQKQQERDYMICLQKDSNNSDKKVDREVD